MGILASDKETETPICSSCITGGMQKLPISGNKNTKNPEKQGILKREQLVPGQRIFSDQFVSSTPGKFFNGRGQQQGHLSYKGGTIFYDAASNYMSIHHQVSFTSNETAQSMLSFERESHSVGVTIKGYNTDNGVYTAKEIMNKLMNDSQTLRLSGVGAHHHNGVAENEGRP